MWIQTWVGQSATLHRSAQFRFEHTLVPIKQVHRSMNWLTHCLIIFLGKALVDLLAHLRRQFVGSLLQSVSYTLALCPRVVMREWRKGMNYLNTWIKICSYLINVSKVIVNILRELSNLRVKQRKIKEEETKTSYYSQFSRCLCAC